MQASEIIIKRLGYEKAKVMLQGLGNEYDAALLEYRRQHNIFEVGDPVIRKWNNQLYWIISDIDNGSEFLIHKNKDAKFKDCKVCELHCNLSHATDAEIEANRRLDLPESVVKILGEVL